MSQQQRLLQAIIASRANNPTMEERLDSLVSQNTHQPSHDVEGALIKTTSSGFSWLFYGSAALFVFLGGYLALKFIRKTKPSVSPSVIQDGFAKFLSNAQTPMDSIIGIASETASHAL